MSTPVITHTFTIDGLELFSKAAWPDGTTIRSIVRWRCHDDGSAHVDAAMSDFERRVAGRDHRSEVSVVHAVRTPFGTVNIATVRGLRTRTVPRVRAAGRQLQVRWLRRAVAVRLPEAA